MCSKKTLSLMKFECLLFVAGLILTCGFGQNAKPADTFEKGLRKEYLQGQSSEVVTATSGQRFNWKTIPEGEKMFYEDREDLLARKSVEIGEKVVAGKDDNKGRILLSTANSAKLPLRQRANATTTISSVVRRRNGSKGNKKRRRDKGLTKLGLRARESNSMITSKFGRRSSLRINDTIGIAENQIKRKREGNNAREQIKRKFGYDKSFRGKRLKEAREKRRKLRLERRRRRKNRERRRRNKVKQNGGRSGGQPKLQKKLDQVPAALFLGQFEGPNYNDTSFPINGLPNVTVLEEANEEIRTSSKPLQKSMAVLKKMQWKENPEENEIRSNFSKLAESDAKELLSTKSKDTKSKERPDRLTDKSRILSMSSQTNANDDSKPEKRLSKSRLSKFVSSRFDAEKMLGYSRSKYPIYDLENDVFAQTLKDYNVYVTSGRKAEVPSVYGFLSVPKGSSLVNNNNDTDLMADTPLSKRNDFYPTIRIIPDKPADSKTSDVRIAEDDATALTQTSDDVNVKGDISCINGTFLPAPLARHALIKYVKSSAPGHEYLEADYECTPGSYMASATNRLLCKDRKWIGQIPRCKVRQNPDDACAESSCDQVCKVVDGRTECSCYKGFRLDGRRCIDVNECDEDDGGCEYKCLNTPGSYRCDCPKGMRQGEDKYSCMDINECLLNNGHGPCQDTCRNLDGGYECSCEGLPDTVLSSDNHTCEDAGPCSINNTGCSHTCLSTMGRVFCLCPDGFMLEDDWKTCQDVDECAVPDLQTEVCQYGCVNTPGSYRCAEPLELRDQPILDSLAVSCLSGYELSEDGSCTDIDECSVNNSGCTEVCVNTNGSFFCTCDSNEKILSADGKSCIDIIDVACPPLNPAGRGYLMCSRLMTPRPWRGRRRVVNRPGTKCYLRCPRGYELHGEYELTCRVDGTWDGPKHGECVRYAMPRLECPENIVTEVPPGRSEAFVPFQQPSTDLDWSRYVFSKPAWGMRLEVSLKPGLHEVTFFARHPVSKKQTSCVLRVIVKEGEAPRVKYCPGNTEIIGGNDTIVTWMEPIFTDNVKVTHISSNRSPGRSFEIGEHKIEYEASDEAGWTTKCVFSVTIRQE